jgi:hypothetical protein
VATRACLVWKRGRALGFAVESLHRDAGTGAKPIPNHGESLGLLEQFGRLPRDVRESAAQFGSTKAYLPSIERGETPNRVSETFLEARPIDHGDFDVLTKRIETSHRQLAAQLEAAGANETNTLKDLIAGAAKKIEVAREADQSQRVGAPLEREIANLVGRLDRAGEGFASLASLETAIDGLSVQLEETRRTASSHSHAARGEPPAASVKSSSDHGDDTKRILSEIAELRTLHEDIWQRIHLALTGIQQSVEQIAKATKAGAGLHGFGLVPSSSDPFAPIFSFLSQHSQDGSLAAGAVRAGVNDPGTSDKAILLAGEAFAADRVQRTAKEKTAPPVFSLNPALVFRAGAKRANRADRIARRPSPRMIARKGQAAQISSPPPGARRERHKRSCRGQKLSPS